MTSVSLFGHATWGLRHDTLCGKLAPPRVDVWSALLRARAIENQCYVAGVNRMGTDPTCEYSGGSAIIDPYGKTIAECPWSRESAVSADIDMEALQAFRKKFPVLDDADPFTLI